MDDPWPWAGWMVSGRFVNVCCGGRCAPRHVAIDCYRSAAVALPEKAISNTPRPATAGVSVGRGNDYRSMTKLCPQTWSDFCMSELRRSLDFWR